MRDQNPWPIVRTCPIKYQNNLHVDPCASFRDETTYKAEYFVKKRCAPNKWYGPSRGHTLPILPFNDTTINRLTFPAYSPNQYKEAKTDSGNPNGILWDHTNVLRDGINVVLYSHLHMDIPSSQSQGKSGEIPSKPTIKTRVRKGADCTPPPENITMFQMPPGTTVEDILNYLAQQERK
ncbi:unnamed protein product [Orchesella dallaii]|uniref:Uncharacterized protein n=1 Tax=Orchesella dallaii TaxID=48710 RepID=A0ABP1QP83_9HEXA